MTEKFSLPKKRFYLLLFIAMLSWGISWSNAKVVGEYQPSMIIMFWRFLLSAISLLPVIVVTSPDFQKLKSSRREILTASILLVGYNYCYFTGTHLGLAGIGGVVVTTLVPVFTILLSRFVFKSILTKLTIFGIFLGLTSGVIMLQLWKYSYAEIIQNGNIYFISGAVIWAILTILTQKITQKVDTLLFSFVTFLMASIIILCLNPEVLDLTIFSLEFRFWIHFLSVTLGAMSFGTVAFFYAAKNLGSHRAGAFIYIVPVSALGFSFIILDEKPEMVTLIGAKLALIAVYLINLSQRKHRV